MLETVPTFTFFEDIFFQAIRPDPEETVSEWADQYMVLPSEDAEPGPWRTSRVPFMKDIMDALSPWNDTREVILMKPVQISGTTAGLCWGGHTIHRAPTNMMIVEPTLDLAKKYSKQRLRPMLRNVEVLSGLVEPERSRDSTNTMYEKEFRGGRIALTGSNSAVGLRFMSVRNLMLDEVDAYEKNIDNEGDPIRLAKNRTATYYRHKIYMLSTPKLKDTSAIEPAYQGSDKRKYFVPCPFCDHGQVLEWKQVTWPQGKPQEARYLCEQCHQYIDEFHKDRMLADGDWVSTLTTEELAAWRPNRAGFWLNILYQPYGWQYSWPTLAYDFSEITHRGDVQALQEFTNTKLAETWEEDLGETLPSSELWNRREIYPAPVPDPVQVLTASVDVQDDRLEAECAGWGIGEELWVIEKQVFWGSPGDKRPGNVWELLDRWLQEPMVRGEGTLTIQAVCIDTGGHFTQEAYAFVKPRQGRRVYAVKGSNQPGSSLIAGRSKKNLARVSLFSIGTDTAKDAIISRLKLQTPGPGYIHFPAVPSYDEEHFDQLCAEVKVTKKHKGVVIGHYYKKTRNRNEALDLMVMHLAALALLNPRLLPPPPVEEPESEPPNVSVMIQRTKRKSSFVNRWRR